ncbi:MAG: DoxX family protein [Cyclobacteriaceae bacterium]|nr:DoxX family protein [Cyclobacteriaceae bacterium]
MKTSVLFWIARIVAAVILVQTLYFKFSAAPESVFIFSTVGIEPWGRWLVGFLELVASVMLFIPATIWLGSILGIGLMVGALGMHVTLLGIEVQGDGGQLFIYALIVLICTLYSFWKSRQTIPTVLRKFLPSFLQ